MKYQVWMEGYRATGDSNTAQYLGHFEADNFEAACAEAARHRGWKTSPGEFQPGHDGQPPEFWGCRLFDNERDARRFCG